MSAKRSKRDSEETEESSDSKEYPIHEANDTWVVPNRRRIQLGQVRRVFARPVGSGLGFDCEVDVQASDKMPCGLDD